MSTQVEIKELRVSVPAVPGIEIVGRPHGGVECRVGDFGPLALLSKFLSMVELTGDGERDRNMAETLEKACETIGNQPDVLEPAVLTLKRGKTTLASRRGTSEIIFSDQLALNEAAVSLAIIARSPVSLRPPPESARPADIRYPGEVTRQLRRAALRLRGETLSFEDCYL